MHLLICVKTLIDAILNGWSSDNIEMQEKCAREHDTHGHLILDRMGEYRNQCTTWWSNTHVESAFTRGNEHRSILKGRHANLITYYRQAKNIAL